MQSAFFSTGATLFILVGAGVLTVPVSLLLLALYRRALRVAMRRRSPAEVDDEPASLPSRLAPATHPLVLEVVEQGQAQRLPEPARAIVQSASNRIRASLLIYGFAALVYGLAGSLLLLSSEGVELAPIRVVLDAWILAWPVVLTANLLAAGDHRQELQNLLVYGGGLAVLALTQGTSWYLVPALWLLIIGPVSVLVLVFLQVRLRAVAPLVFAFMVTIVTGAHFGLAAADTNAGLDVAADITVALGGWLDWAGLGVFAMAGALLAGALGFLALTLIKNAYQGKRISDQSLTIDAVWLVFTITLAVTLADAGLAWAVAGLSTFALFKAIATLGFRMLGRGRHPTSYQLLLLRTFGTSARTGRLLTRLASRWRYVGSIQVIAGVDLADTVVQPHEFLEFMRGRLARRYIHDRAALERRLAQTDTRPDADGRFRVTQFFCYDDTWQPTISRLVTTADAILMDLRGFTSANQGCVFELEQLVLTVPVERVLLVTDQTTDTAFLDAVVQRAWSAVPATSPNYQRADAGRLATCHLKRDDANGVNFLFGRITAAVGTIASPARCKSEVG